MRLRGRKRSLAWKVGLWHDPDDLADAANPCRANSVWRVRFTDSRSELQGESTQNGCRLL
jgi:hypothetical protein